MEGEEAYEAGHVFRQPRKADCLPISKHPYGTAPLAQRISKSHPPPNTLTGRPRGTAGYVQRAAYRQPDLHHEEVPLHRTSIMSLFAAAPRGAQPAELLAWYLRLPLAGRSSSWTARSLPWWHPARRSTRSSCWATRTLASTTSSLLPLLVCVCGGVYVCVCAKERVLAHRPFTLGHQVDVPARVLLCAGPQLPGADLLPSHPGVFIHQHAFPDR